MDLTTLWEELRYEDWLSFNAAGIFALAGLALIILAPLVMAMLDLRRLDHPIRRLGLVVLIGLAVLAFHFANAQVQAASILTIQTHATAASYANSGFGSPEYDIEITEAVGAIADWAFMILAVVATLKVFTRSDLLGIDRVD